MCTVERMEIINRDGARWPDPVDGPFDVWTTVAIIDGRPEVVGVEMWAVDPAALPKRVTHLAKAEAERHWPRYPEPSWDSREGPIRSKDLRLPLGRIVADYMARQRGIAKAWTTPGRMAKARQTLEGSATVTDEPGFWETPKAQAAARHIVDLTDEARPKKAGRPSLPAAHYVEVAKVYTEALRNGANPRAAVKEHFHVSKSSAAKWVYRCRLAPLNLLAKTSPGRAAGAFDPDNATPKPKGTK